MRCWTSGDGSEPETPRAVSRDRPGRAAWTHPQPHATVLREWPERIVVTALFEKHRPQRLTLDRATPGRGCRQWRAGRSEPTGTVGGSCFRPKTLHPSGLAAP